MVDIIFPVGAISLICSIRYFYLIKNFIPSGKKNNFMTFIRLHHDLNPAQNFCIKPSDTAAGFSVK